MRETKPLIDPKDLAPFALGLLLAVALMAFFALLCQGMGLPLLVNHADIPHH